MIKLTPNNELELAIQQVGIFSEKMTDSMQEGLEVREREWYFGSTKLVQGS